MNTTLLEFAQQLTARRKQRGMTQSQLALAAGLGLQTVVRMEQGHPGVGMGNVVAVLTALDMPMALANAHEDYREALPEYPLHLNHAKVSDAVEQAAAQACEVLDQLFSGLPERHGINSNFQGLLIDHLKAMLQGYSHHEPRHRVTLNRLVFGPQDYGPWQRLPEGAAGFHLRLQGTEDVLWDDRVRSISRVDDCFATSEAAEAYFIGYLEREGYPPAPVSVAPCWWASQGCSFTAGR